MEPGSSEAPAFSYHYRPAWLALVMECSGRCLRCVAPGKPTVDHVIPLDLGGPNTIENVQVLCAACNSEKGSEIIRITASAERGDRGGPGCNSLGFFCVTRVLALTGSDDI